MVDLGIRMRDQLLRGDVIANGVRKVLSERLAAVARSGRLALSPGLVDALLATWPLAAMIDDAVDTWRAGPDPAALAVMWRGMQVVSSAIGWPETIDRAWPMPDPEWIAREAGPGPHVVVPRGPRDGAPAIAAVLGAPLARIEPIPLPPVVVGQGDELAARLDSWLAAIAAGDAVAVRFETPIPWDAETRAALDRLETEVPVQRAFARFGHAALVCPEVTPFDALLDRAPPGVRTERPTALCDALILPHIDENGRTSLAGALCWDGPFEPVLVHPFAVEVMERLDGHHALSDLARELQAVPATLASVLDQLAEIGAIG